MSSDIIVALIAFTGTFLGTIGGIFASNKLVTYRLAQLEKKVESHNDLVVRMTKAEIEILHLRQETNIKGDE